MARAPASAAPEWSRLARMTSRPWMASGMKGIGRRGHDVGDRGELVGRSCRRGHEGRDRLGRGRQDEHAPGRRLQGMQLEAEAGDDAEVAATTPDGPEEVRVGLGVHEPDLAVGGDELRAEQRVDGETVLAHEVAEARPPR